MDQLSDYDYELPEELIAQEPLENRSGSRLLVLQNGKIQHRFFSDVADMLKPGDLLVVNETRVTACRLFGQRANGGDIEALIMREVTHGLFEVLLKPAKRAKPGSELNFHGVPATVVDFVDGPVRRLQVQDHAEFQKMCEAHGQVPLPPYIRQAVQQGSRYDTVYATQAGSAAAPTAGLHFTPELLSTLQAKGVQIAKVSLDVGIDTFRPVETENLDEHKMHGEVCRIPSDTAQAIATCPGRVIAVGTTTVRTLESFAVGPRKVEAGEQRTSLFIRPGFQFQVVNGMFTNFHLPKTTMLCMISALAGRENIMSAYKEAVREKYRFLSFGDSMLILP